MTIAYLGLGSNLRNPERQLRQALIHLRKTHGLVLLAQSTIHHTPPWGITAQPPFCNMVVAIKTNAPPRRLMHICQSIEYSMGRVRKKRWGPRIIDIDILLYGNYTIKSPSLTIPHPYLSSRAFVVEPLREMGIDTSPAFPVH